MKIALLNLPFDNNYGGNLQRYALVKVLQDMGHEVVHIFLNASYYLPWYKIPYSYPKRLVKNVLFGVNLPVFYEQYMNALVAQRNAAIEPFYEQYIPHTEKVYNLKDICRIAEKYSFDAYCVGSDQVWRKDMTACIGLENYFFEFLKDKKVKRIAYAVSLGTDRNELTNRSLEKLSSLYCQFDAVSVRENSALALLYQNGWTFPPAQLVLDPTLLLTKEKYCGVIDAAETNQCQGDMFCYILDLDIEKKSVIDEYSQRLGLVPFFSSIYSITPDSVEQWLRSFRDAKFIITDSFHGLVFSLLFNKSFKLLYNKRRGNARFRSLIDVLGIDESRVSQDWDKINEKLEEMREKSNEFLKLVF